MEENLFLEESNIVKELYEEITDSEVEELGIDLQDEKFAITSEEQANFFLRRVAEIRSERDKINATCDREIERFSEKVNAYRNREVNTLNNTENYFSQLLESYARSVLAGGKKKSKKLAFGTLGFKKVSPSFIYNDEVILNFIKKNNLEEKYIRVKEELNKKDFKAAVIRGEDGSIKIGDLNVEGLEITEESEKFTIK